MGQCYTDQRKPKFNLKQQTTFSIHILPQNIAEINGQTVFMQPQKVEKQAYLAKTQDSEFVTAQNGRKGINFLDQFNQKGDKLSPKGKPESDINSKFQMRSTADPQQVKGYEFKEPQTDDTLQAYKRKVRQAQNKAKLSWISNRGNKQEKYHKDKNSFNCQDVEKEDEINGWNQQREHSWHSESSMYSLKQKSRRRIFVLPDDPQKRQGQFQPSDNKFTNKGAQLSGETTMQYRPASLLGVRQQPTNYICCL